MAENSGIGWTTHTMNFWWGCDKVSAECLHCYIAAFMKWAGKEPFNGPIRTKDWSKPLRWNRKAAITGERPRIFTCSMSDFFHPGADEWRSEAWEIIRASQNLVWLILTKRPELIPDRLPSDCVLRQCVDVVDAQRDDVTAKRGRSSQGNGCYRWPRLGLVRPQGLREGLR